MEVPQAAVNTLSDTAWGAIWLITVFGMGSAITYLIMTVRGNNKTILDLADKRYDEARSFGDMSRELEREALNATNAAREAVEDLQDATKAVERELRAFKEKVSEALNCRDCPARMRLRGDGT
jgi:hypothetical protein